MDTENHNSSYCVLKLVFWMFVIATCSSCSDELNSERFAKENTASQKLLRAEEAFRYTLENTDKSIKINWSINDGYYLYQKKLQFKSSTPSIQLGNIIYPNGSRHEDEFFGVQQVYRGDVSIEIPYKSSNDLEKSFDLEIFSQGCADQGICYPPQKWLKTIKTDTAPDFNQKNLFNNLTNNDLKANDAFIPFLTQIDKQTLEIAFQIKPRHYLYKNKIAVTSQDSDIQIGAIELPKGIIKNDDWFGETEVFYNEVFGRVSFKYSDPARSNLDFILNYQGCIEDEICLPPQQTSFKIELMSSTLTDVGIEKPIKISEQSRLANLISSAHILMVILTFYVAGLLLSFTPCVLPMIPILSGILAGEGEQITPKRGFILSSSYVLGMAIVYTMAGIISASIGLQLQAFFNAPWVIIIFVAIFIWLALAMFDLVNMELPSIFQNRLSKLNDQQKSGTIIGSFFIGAISSLIVTACVAPPLVATLMVIGQTGDVLRGGVALLAMSFGMGTPLIVIGTSAGKLLPKAGEWMNKVKHIFGFLMLGLAIYMLSRILDATFILALWGILALLMGVFFGGLNVIDKNSKNSEKGAKGIGLLAIIYGAALILGSLSGNTNPLQPLANIGIINGQKTIASELHFKRIKSLDNLNSELAQAKLQNKSVMLDFYADWCVSCKEMEAYTFTDERVQNSLANTILLQADVTANDEIDQALLNELNVFGPPTIIFYNKDGIKKNGYEVVGYMKAKEFARHTQSALNTNPII